MAGDTEQLSSSSEEVPLSFMDLIKVHESQKDVMDKLRPPLPEGYFEGKEHIFDEVETKKGGIRPYVDFHIFPGRRDENGDKQMGEIGIEIGLKGEF